MKRIVKSLLTEYGLRWTLNRGLYSLKISMLAKIPYTEKLFEKKVFVKRTDIFNFNITAISNFLTGLEDKKKVEIISIADMAINGVIKGFSSIELNYGNPINWHLNPLTKIESRRDLKWYQIPDFDPKIGDIKVIWEASRLTHFLYFTRAYLITCDAKYYKAFSDQLADWLKNNLYSYGSNYKCGQEAALRMINVLIAYSVFKTCGITTEEDRENVFRIVEYSYKKVISNFFYAHKCIRNNHTFSEILGLIIGAWCCEEEAEVRKAYRLFDKEILAQFLEDGGFTQYSLNYHRFTLQIIECLFKVSEVTGISINEKERIKKSVLLLYQLQDLEGDVPNYGSNDGALIFPLTTCGYRDFRPVANTVYALIEGKRLYENGDYDEEILWFGCEKELQCANIKKESSSFINTGFYSIRHDDGFLMTCLQNFKSRPAHMDQLHIDLWHRGINIFCDSGTYSYAGELGSELTSTIGHNVVKVKDLQQMNRSGAFLVYDWTSSSNVKYDNNSFSGTMKSKNGYTHTRKIVKTQYGYEIEDNVKADSNECSFLFHTLCDVKVNSHGFELFKAGKKLCIVKMDFDAIKIHKAYRSLYYLKKDEINRICVIYKIINKECNMKISIVLV